MFFRQVAWFDVDQPDIAGLKAASLTAAGADVGLNPHELAGQQEVTTGNHGSRDATADRICFPLLCGSYALMGADLSCTPLEDVMLPSGFDTSVPTVWILEALVYYMPLDAASRLLQVWGTLRECWRLNRMLQGCLLPVGN
jgi:hypothetical protein